MTSKPPILWPTGSGGLGPWLAGDESGLEVPSSNHRPMSMPHRSERVRACQPAELWPPKKTERKPSAELADIVQWTPSPVLAEILSTSAELETAGLLPEAGSNHAKALRLVGRSRGPREIVSPGRGER